MKFDLFTAKAPPLFGLDISSSSVKMLELVDAGKGGYRVERYAIEPLARDSVVDGNINNLEAVGDAVKRAYQRLDRKSTRLNSSHGYISYAVFCLKKKKNRLNHI